MSAMGKCEKCNAENEYSKFVCDFCGARLPWAEAVKSGGKPTAAALAAPSTMPATNATTQNATAQAIPQTVPAVLPAASCGKAVGVGCGLMFALFVILPLGCAMIFGSGDKATESEAYVMAKMSIERQLKSPSTAKFPYSDGARFVHNGDTVTVIGYVDAQNSFGAMLRERWTATLHKTSDGKDWVLDSADLID